MKRIEHALEMFIFGSRWLLMPFYLGLIGGIALLLVKFIKSFVALVSTVFYGESGHVLLGVLSLVDTALVANLLLIIIFAGYENFVSKIDTGKSEDRPSWMGHTSFSDLKLKLIGSIVAISSIELLRYFINVKETNNLELAWAVGIQLTLVFSGVMFALMDRIADVKHSVNEHRAVLKGGNEQDH